MFAMLFRPAESGDNISDTQTQNGKIRQSSSQFAQPTRLLPR